MPRPSVQARRQGRSRTMAWERTGSASAIAAAGRAGLVDVDLGEQRQARLEPFPDPDREALRGRVVEPLDVVEAAVVERVEQRRERRLDVGEVDDPAELRVDRTLDVHVDAERMPVHARALVPCRHVRKAVGRLDLEGLVQSHRVDSRGGGYGWTRTTDLSIMSAAL